MLRTYGMTVEVQEQVWTDWRVARFGRSGAPWARVPTLYPDCSRDGGTRCVLGHEGGHLLHRGTPHPHPSMHQQSRTQSRAVASRLRLATRHRKRAAGFAQGRIVHERQQHDRPMQVLPTDLARIRLSCRRTLPHLRGHLLGPLGGLRGAREDQGRDPSPLTPNRPTRWVF